MKYIKKLERSIAVLNYKKGDIVIPVETDPYGKNPKDSYSVIDEVKGGGNSGAYMISTYNIYTGKKLEGPWPIFDSEIVRKLTPEEILNIPIISQTKYNL